MPNLKQYDLDFFIKITILKEKPSFGPGIAKILQLVKETNKLTEAYSAMKLSSSKGWKVIKQAEKDLGFPLIISSTGGKHGGSSTLTPEGEEILYKYQSFVNELNLEARKIFDKHFKSK